MSSDVKKLLKKHPDLTQSDMMKVTSHVQREQVDRIITTEAEIKDIKKENANER